VKKEMLLMDNSNALDKKMVANDNGSNVSIVICTKNEASNIKTALDSLIENNIMNQKVEVIIVDGYSTDKTAEIASEYPVRMFFESTGTRGGASNVGWKNANGDIIVYTNADCLFSKDWIINILKFFGDSKTAVVGGVDLTPPITTSYFEKASGLLDELRIFPRHRRGLVFRLRGCNVAYRKSALASCNGFDENFHFAEETELQYRLFKKGYHFAFDPSIVVYHKRRSSLAEYWKQFYGAGFGKFQLVEKHPSSLFAPEVFTLPFLSALLFVSIIAYVLGSILFLPLFIGTLLIPTIYTIYVMRKVYLHVRSLHFLPGALIALFLRNVALLAGFFCGALSRTINRIRSRKK